MPIYTVTFERLLEISVTVTAPTPDEAQDKAVEKLESLKPSAWDEQTTEVTDIYSDDSDDPDASAYSDDSEEA
jgi:hypothetical protein